MMTTRDSGRKLRVGHEGRFRLERHTMSDQYPIPMIQNALNFCGFVFPDKHTATTGMCCGGLT